MKLLAITACPTGIAHTYMAAEALEQAAADAGHEMVVETQGSAGTTRSPTPRSTRPTRSSSPRTSRSATRTGSRTCRPSGSG